MKTSALPSWIIALTAIVLFGCVVWFDTVVLEFSLIAEDTAPYGSPPFLFRTVLLIGAAGLLFLGLLQQQVETRRADEPAWFEDRLRWGGLTIALIATAIFLMDEDLFYDLGKEDKLIEQLSTVCLFGASACFMWLMGRLATVRPMPPGLFLLVTCGFTSVFFFMAMEEISWFQRVFEIETPDTILDLSERDEINVHNMNTALAENVYYFGSFVLLVLVPFVHERTRLFSSLAQLSPALSQLDVLVPTRTVALIAAPAFAFNYDMWNPLFMQFAFWFTLLVTGYYTWQAWTQSARDRQDRIYTLSVLLTVILTQAVFLIDGERFVRLWDSTEYKELIIPFSFLVYSFLTARTIRLQLNLVPSGVSLRSPVVISLGLFLLVCLHAVLDDNVTSSELDVLMLAKQFAQPDFMPDEFYLNQSETPRTLFLAVLAPLMQTLSFMQVSILGRLIQFLVLSLSLGLIARRLGLDAFGAAIAVGIYLIYEQTILPGGDAIFDRIEAMNFAYAGLFFGLYAVLDRRLWLAGLCLGVATSFHLLVGIWGTLTLGLTVLSERIGSWRERFYAAGVWCVGGIFGLTYLFSFLSETPPALSYNVSSLYVYFRVPHDLYPLDWKLSWENVWLAGGLCWVVARARLYFPDQMERTVVARFALWSLLPFAGGLIVAPFSFAPHFLRAYPFRISGTLLLLLGAMLGILVVLQYIVHRKAQTWLLAAGALYCFWLSSGEFVEGYHEIRRFPRGAEWRGTKVTRAVYDVCDWVRDNTEPGAMLIAPPDEQPIAYLCHRPVVVRFKSIPFQKADIAEWYNRLVAFNGGEEPKRRGYPAAQEIAKNFNRLSEQEYQALGRQYGGKYLLVRKVRKRKKLTLPKLYQNKKYAVYKLQPEPVPDPVSESVRAASLEWTAVGGNPGVRMVAPLSLSVVSQQR